MQEFVDMLLIATNKTICIGAVSYANNAEKSPRKNLFIRDTNLYTLPLRQVL